MHPVFKVEMGSYYARSWGTCVRLRRGGGIAALLTGLGLILGSCKQTTPSLELVTEGMSLTSQEPKSLHLLWRLPGMEAPQSLLSTHTVGRVLLALKLTGKVAVLDAFQLRRRETLTWW